MVNPGFEASGTPGWPGYIQPAPISGWTATGNYGVNVSGPGPFANNGSNPEQDRVAFLQGEATLTQTVWELEDGEAYHLSFSFNARGGNKPTLNVTVNGETALEYEVNPVGDAEPYYVYVYNFTADSDVAEITFAQTAAGDNTVLLDDVRLVKGVYLEPAEIAHTHPQAISDAYAACAEQLLGLNLVQPEISRPKLWDIDEKRSCNECKRSGD